MDEQGLQYDLVSADGIFSSVADGCSLYPSRVHLMVQTFRSLSATGLKECFKGKMPRGFRRDLGKTAQSCN